jgi:hypothetical protein
LHEVQKEYYTILLKKRIIVKEGIRLVKMYKFQFKLFRYDVVTEAEENCIMRNFIICTLLFTSTIYTTTAFQKLITLHQNKIKEHDMCGEFNTNRGIESTKKILVGKIKGRNHSEYLSVDERMRMILKWILERQSWRVQIGFI